MSAALLSLLVALVLAAVAVAVLGALTLVPFVLSVDTAEHAGYGTVRWGLASAVCSLVGLGVLYVSHEAGLGPVPELAGLAATWAAPLALRLLGPAGGRLAGARGRHE